MKKSLVWFIVWAALLMIGFGFAMVSEIVYILNTGAAPVYPPYAAHQVFWLFVYLPLVIMPPICLSFYYSVKEKVKPLKIITMCIFIQHIIVLIGAIVDAARA